MAYLKILLMRQIQLKTLAAESVMSGIHSQRFRRLYDFTSL